MPKPCAEKKMLLVEITVTAFCNGTSGSSGGESDSLTVEMASITSLVICCTVLLKGL